MYVLTANIEIWPHAVVQMVGSAIRCLDKSLSMFLSSLILIHWSFCQVALKQWRIIKPSPQKLVAAAANERWLFTKQFTYLEGFGVLRRCSARGTRQLDNDFLLVKSASKKITEKIILFISTGFFSCIIWQWSMLERWK